MAGLGSFGLVFLSIAFLDIRSKRVNSIRQLIEQIGIPVLGTIPLIPRSASTRKKGRWAGRARYWHSVLTESIDASRTMLLRDANADMKVFMVASAASGEGKTTTSCHLATSLARAGNHVLLIDGDLRRPFVHRTFDITAGPGLAEVIRGEHELDAVLQPSGVARLPILSAGKSESTDLPVTIIEARKGLQLIDVGELLAYRDLFLFLTWRSIKVLYAQSAIGIGWAIIQPVFSMLVFTVVFGKLAGIDSEGVPYAVFSFTALVPWTYFSNALTQSTNSLVQNANMISKVYFPRLILPLSAVTAKLLDFAIAMLVLAGLMAWYGVAPNWNALALPLLIVLMIVTAAGLGAWLTALAIQYRDVKHAMTFVVQLMMYAAPVVYPTSLIPEQYQYAYALNPMVGVIEGFRAALLGTRAMPWDFIVIGTASSLLIAFTGLVYFRNRERLFADVA
eukprot:g10227.t1